MFIFADFDSSFVACFPGSNALSDVNNQSASANCRAKGNFFSFHAGRNMRDGIDGLAQNMPYILGSCS
jgi:hypothetical protein